MDRKHCSLYFGVGDKIFLRVFPLKGVMRFNKGPFEILSCICQATYELALPPALSAIYLVFFIFLYCTGIF